MEFIQKEIHRGNEEMTLIYWCNVDDDLEFDNERYEKLVAHYTRELKHRYTQLTPKFKWEIKSGNFNIIIDDGLETTSIEGPPLG